MTRKVFGLVLLICAVAFPAAQHAATQRTDKPSLIRTVVDLSLSELVRSFPELKKLAFTESQADLPQLLDRVGSRVDEMFQSFPNTSARERIRMEMMNLSGVTARTATKDFQYLLFAKLRRSESGAKDPSPSRDVAEIGIEEFRTDSKGSEINILKMEISFLITGGYVAIPLYFHPAYREGSDFRYLGRDPSANNDHVIAYAQVPERARIAGTFHSHIGPVVFLTQGIVWVDPDTYQMVRMRTELLTPLPEAGLLEQTTEIELQEIRFGGTSRSLWLPRQVVVNSRFMGYWFRNRHQYSDYRLFTVDAKEDSKRIVTPPKPPL